MAKTVSYTCGNTLTLRIRGNCVRSTLLLLLQDAKVTNYLIVASKSLRALEKEKIAATDITTASFKMNAKRSEPSLAVSSPKKKKKPNPKPATSLFSRPSKDSKQIAHAKNCLILAAQLYNGNVANTIEYVKSRIPADIDPSEYQNYTNDAAELSDESFINVIVGDNNALRRALGIEGTVFTAKGQGTRHIDPYLVLSM